MSYISKINANISLHTGQSTKKSCSHFRFPNLRLLDFRKIKRKERAQTIELFKSKHGKDILKEVARKAKLAPSIQAIGDSNVARGLFNQNCLFPYRLND